jgi:hypothetical protein
MSIGVAAVDCGVEDNQVVGKKSQVADWEVHSWGNGRLPGMAAISAIATLQVGATLTEDPADKLAMNKAADYLIKALAPQLKTFRKILAD